MVLNNISIPNVFYQYLLVAIITKQPGVRRVKITSHSDSIIKLYNILNFNTKTKLTPVPEVPGLQNIPL